MAPVALREQAIAVAEAIVKVPTRSGNPMHDTATGRFVGTRFFDTKTDRQLVASSVPAEVRRGASKRARPGMSRDKFAATFEGFTHEASGITAHVEDVTDWGNGAFVVGTLRNERGRHVGQFEREIFGNGAHNVLLEVAAPYRGKGFASAFNTHAEHAYRQAGVDHVDVDTGLEDGGFVWAISGFLVKPGSLAERGVDDDEQMTHEQRTAAWAQSVVDEHLAESFLPRSLKSLRKIHPQLEPLIDELDRRLVDGSFTLPYQFAMFGHDQPFDWKGEQTWLGKWLLSDSYGAEQSAEWHGRKYL